MRKLINQQKEEDQSIPSPLPFVGQPQRSRRGAAVYGNRNYFHKRRVTISGLLFACLLIVMSLSTPCSASIIAQHSGDTVPGDEGWSVTESGWSGSVGPVTGDLGLDAWNLNNPSSSSFRIYRQTISSADRALGDANGWIYRTNVRVIDAPTTPDGGIWIEYDGVSRRFILALGMQADGDPVVKLGTTASGGVFSGPVLALEGLGSGYHLYELVYDPQTATADLFVNGIERMSDYAGAGGSLGWAVWGAGTFSMGNANYNLVELEIIPEPSTLLLGAFAAVGLLIRNRALR